MHARFAVRMVFALVAVSLLGAQPLLAVDEFGELQTISRLPLTEREVEAAFSRNRGNACELIPQGEALEVNSFTSYLTERDRRATRGSRPIPSSRRDVFSVGLEFEPQDRAALPTVSRGTIVDYLDEHYVSIQARVRRDLLDRKLYYFHRPLALTAEYRGARLTQSFEPLVSGSIREFHSLGLFVPADVGLAKPENFRTIVLLFRVPLLRPGSNRTRESYEYVFIRGRETETDGQAGLEPHVFVTTGDRGQLEYLRASNRPSSPSRCSILGRIAVTEFDSTGIYPKESATRSYRVDQRTTLAMSALDEFCRQQQLAGGYRENLSQVLDAIIDGQLTAQSE